MELNYFHEFLIKEIYRGEDDIVERSESKFVIHLENYRIKNCPFISKDLRRIALFFKNKTLKNIIS